VQRIEEVYIMRRFILDKIMRRFRIRTILGFRITKYHTESYFGEHLENTRHGVDYLIER